MILLRQTEAIEAFVLCARILQHPKHFLGVLNFSMRWLPDSTATATIATIKERRK